MNDIFKYCIRVNGISSYYPIYDEVSQHVLEGDPEYVRTFGWNNGKVSFITEDGSLWRSTSVSTECGEMNMTL